jgi:hypothetical protein
MKEMSIVSLLSIALVASPVLGAQLEPADQLHGLQAEHGSKVVRFADRR